MDPITMAIMTALQAIGPAVSGITQTVQGARDRREGAAMEAAAGDRPEYQIPESIDKMIQMYGQMANQGLPGQGQMSRDIQSQSSRAVGQAAQLADSPVGALTALGGIQERESQAMRDLQTRAAQYRAQAQQNYAQATGQRANFEQEQWRQNQLLPWEIQMNRAAQLQTQGRGNIMGGVDTLGAGLSNAASMYGTMNMYNSMAPNWGDSNVDTGVAQQFNPNSASGKADMRGANIKQLGYF